MHKSDYVVPWLVVLGLIILLFCIPRIGFAHDPAHPEINEWYRQLMRPDFPTSPCCGEADAYWADEFHVRDGKTFVTITDDRDDAPLHRMHVPVGTEIEVPPEKLKFDRGNPTGHGVLFLSIDAHFVFCYVQPGGV